MLDISRRQSLLWTTSRAGLIDEGRLLGSIAAFHMARLLTSILSEAQFPARC